MSLNNIDIYDFGAWIEIAPEFDWELLGTEVAPDPEPAAGAYVATYERSY